MSMIEPTANAPETDPTAGMSPLERMVYHRAQRQQSWSLVKPDKKKEWSAGDPDHAESEAADSNRRPRIEKSVELDENQPTPVTRLNAVLRNFMRRHQINSDLLTTAINAAAHPKTYTRDNVSGSIGGLKSNSLRDEVYAPILAQPDRFFRALPEAVAADRQPLLEAIDAALHQVSSRRVPPDQLQWEDPKAQRLYAAWYDMVQHYGPNRHGISNEMVANAMTHMTGINRSPGYVSVCLNSLKSGGDKLVLFRLIANNPEKFYEGLDLPIPETVKAELNAAASDFMRTRQTSRDGKGR